MKRNRNKLKKPGSNTETKTDEKDDLKTLPMSELLAYRVFDPVNATSDTEIHIKPQIAQQAY
jgi:hypothetical protein